VRQEHELVAAEATGGVHPTEATGKPASNHPENLIAAVVSMLIVDRLETR